MIGGRRDAQDWIGGGPLLSTELVAQVQDVLKDASDLLGHEVPVPHDFPTAVAAVTEAAAAAAAFDPTDREKAIRLAQVSQSLHGVDRQLSALAIHRSRTATTILTKVLPRLEAATCSVSELVEVAPQLVCELGFDRSLISRVENNIWYPELMYIMGDPGWSAEVTEAGKSDPLELVPGLHETELVRTRKPILVTGVREPGHEGWGHPGMVQSSLTHSYVGAPIMSDGEVVGILHADRYGQRRDVDEVDRDLLAAFAEAFRLVLSRAALNDRLQATQAKLDALSVALNEASGAIHEMPVLRLDRSVRDSGDGMVLRVGPRPVSSRPLPETLTRRELEVLGLMASGATNLAIARQLIIADGTAKQHVKHILHKLEVANRSEAVARWFQAGGNLNLAAGPSQKDSREQK